MCREFLGGRNDDSFFKEPPWSLVHGGSPDPSLLVAPSAAPRCGLLQWLFELGPGFFCSLICDLVVCQPLNPTYTPAPPDLQVLECPMLSHLCSSAHPVPFAWHSLLAYLTWPALLWSLLNVTPFRKPSLMSPPPGWVVCPSSVL